MFFLLTDANRQFNPRGIRETNLTVDEIKPSHLLFSVAVCLILVVPHLFPFLLFFLRKRRSNQPPILLWNCFFHNNSFLLSLPLYYVFLVCPSGSRQSLKNIRSLETAVTKFHGKRTYSVWSLHIQRFRQLGTPLLPLRLLDKPTIIAATARFHLGFFSSFYRFCFLQIFFSQRSFFHTLPFIFQSRMSDHESVGESAEFQYKQPPQKTIDELLKADQVFLFSVFSHDAFGKELSGWERMTRWPDLMGGTNPMNSFHMTFLFHSKVLSCHVASWKCANCTFQESGLQFPQRFQKDWHHLQEDESLMVYKQKLLGQGTVIVDANDPRRVIIRSVELLIDGKKVESFDLSDPKKLLNSDLTVSIKEGSNYRLRFAFHVQREIASGLQLVSKDVTRDVKFNFQLQTQSEAVGYHRREWKVYDGQLRSKTRDPRIQVAEWGCSIRFVTGTSKRWIHLFLQEWSIVESTRCTRRSRTMTSTCI